MYGILYHIPIGIFAVKIHRIQFLLFTGPCPIIQICIDSSYQSFSKLCDHQCNGSIFSLLPYHFKNLRYCYNRHLQLSLTKAFHLQGEKNSFRKLTLLSFEPHFSYKNIYLYRMEVSIGEALKQFLKKSKLKSGIQALQIEEAWEKIMGKTIANYTDKIEIINTTLFISTSVAPLKNELIYQKAKIIERVNEALGERVIKEVVIK
jgi:hypothetical protein